MSGVHSTNLFLFCSTILQARDFFVTWKHLRASGPYASGADRLAVLNLLLFSVSVTDGLCCPQRPRDFVKRMMDESLNDGRELSTPGHMDLWMKDLSPDDSTVRNTEGDRKREQQGGGRNARLIGWFEDVMTDRGGGDQ